MAASVTISVNGAEPAERKRQTNIKGSREEGYSQGVMPVASWSLYREHPGPA